MRALPQNLETEETLLGALLANPSKAMRACWDAGLRAEDFSLEAHGLMYRVISEQLSSGNDVDDRTLIDQLRRMDVPTERGKSVNALTFVGGEAIVMSLSMKGIVSLAGQYAAEIVSQALSRDLILVGDELIEKGADLAPIADTVTAAERRLAAARDRADGRTGLRKQTDVADLLQEFLEHYISPEPDDLIPFQLPTLNALGGGMAPGDIVVVGARSGVGKSWWGLDTIEQVAGVGRRSVLFSLEMPQAQMVRRLMSMGGLNLTGIKKRVVAYESMIDRIGVLDAWRGLLDIVDGPTTVDRIHAVLSSARIDGNPYRLVVVDHLHLMDVPGRGSEYRINLNVALTRLKHLAVEHGITLVLLGQLTKPGAGERHKRPTIFDLRESNGIGDIADYVLLLHREPGEDGHPTNAGAVIVDKVRDGAGATDISVVFDPRSYRFREGYLAGMTHTRSVA